MKFARKITRETDGFRSWRYAAALFGQIVEISLVFWPTATHWGVQCDRTILALHCGPVRTWVRSMRAPAVITPEAA